MATANVTNDLEHFVNCGVCFCEFDEEIRKPKFLLCAHTVCLKCLQEICRAGVITCPFCRKNFLYDTASLPNNSYALQMIKLKEERENAKCRTCGSVGNAEIMEQTKKLTAVLKKRKEVQGELDAIAASVADQVKKLQEENDIEIGKLISLIEVTPQPTASRSLPNAISPMTADAKLLQSSMQSYIFILKVSIDILLPIGEIRIRPALTFHPEFVQQLGQFCYKSPKTFTSTVDKAQAGVFVSIFMSHWQFRPTLGATNQTARIGASKMGEVGVIFKKSNLIPVGFGPNTITDWNFFIPLNPVNLQQKSVISSAGAELFGHIIDTCSSPNKAVAELSMSKRNERDRYTMSLESQ